MDNQLRFCRRAGLVALPYDPLRGLNSDVATEDRVETIGLMTSSANRGAPLTETFCRPKEAHEGRGTCGDYHLVSYS